MSQIVDTATAKEFMKETLEKIEEQDLVRISDALGLKSQKFQQKMSRENLEQISEEEIHEILRLIFSTRRKAKKILADNGKQHLKENIQALLYGEDRIDIRFQQFCDRINGLKDHIHYDLAGELLHFTFPEKYWLWCHWMWNPRIKTGSLPLVTMEDFDLNSPSLGEGYLKVGKAVAFIHEVGEAAGYQTISRSLFGTDVYLSCVYVIYAYTVLRMRMTQEFNQVMPGVSEFSSRILGVHKIEELQN